MLYLLSEMVLRYLLSNLVGGYKWPSGRNGTENTELGYFCQIAACNPKYQGVGWMRDQADHDHRRSSARTCWRFHSFFPPSQQLL